MLTCEPLLPEPSRVMIDGTAVATRVLEPTHPAGGELVLCHGTPWSSRIWAGVARELSIDYRVFLWDMPGYGESEKGPKVATDLATQAERLAALVRMWGIERPHVVAHDIGGAVALRAHLLHGVEYAGLSLWDAVTHARPMGVAILPSRGRERRRVRPTSFASPCRAGQGIHRRGCLGEPVPSGHRCAGLTLAGLVRADGVLPADRLAQIRRYSSSRRDPGHDALPIPYRLGPRRSLDPSAADLRTSVQARRRSGSRRPRWRRASIALRGSARGDRSPARMAHAIAAEPRRFVGCGDGTHRGRRIQERPCSAVVGWLNRSGPRISAGA
ncbi:alpha/beta fold hydrolase [Zhihengliuella sp.]|uniref:alpha/beta fold hydrolase n=1 Tax=Zhihengliuella sp. TaxID=1954483 RepID=UPI0035BF0F5B